MRQSTRKPARNQTIEILRILAAFGVVAFHAEAMPVDVFYAGLIVFLAVSPMFETGANFGLKRKVSDLAATFLVPFVFWFAVYGLLNVIKGKPILVEADVLGVFAGTSIHLWFLPFMFVVLLVLNRLKMQSFELPLFVFALLAGVATVATSPLWQDMTVLERAPLAQWVHALPAVFFGICIGLSQHSRTRSVAVVAGVITALALIWSREEPLFSPIAYTLGLLSLLIAQAIPTRWTAGINVRPLSDCMMGVYLMHPIGLYIFGQVYGHGTMRTALSAFLATVIATMIVRVGLPALKPFALGQQQSARLVRIAV